MAGLSFGYHLVAIMAMTGVCMSAFPAQGHASHAGETDFAHYSVSTAGDKPAGVPGPQHMHPVTLQANAQTLFETTPCGLEKKSSSSPGFQGLEVCLRTTACSSQFEMQEHRAQRAQAHPKILQCISVTMCCLFKSTGSTWWPASLPHCCSLHAQNKTGQDGAEPAIPGSWNLGTWNPRITMHLQSRPGQQKGYAPPEHGFRMAIASKAKRSSNTGPPNRL